MEEIKINFLHPHDFIFWNTLSLYKSLKIYPRMATSRIYKLSEDEMHSASVKLKKKSVL